MITIQNLQKAEEQCGRSYMEDRGFAMNITKRYFAAFVFDGHNGSEAAEFLHGSVPSLIYTLLEEAKDDEKAIEDGMKSMFQLLNSVFQKRPDKRELNAGSTLCGLLIDRLADRILYVNCGDSGVVIYGPQGKSLFVSVPDGLETHEKRASVSDAGGKVVRTSDGMWRLGGFINMSRVFGDFELSDDFEETIKKIGGRDVQTKWINKVTDNRKSVRVVLGTDGLFDEFPAETFASSPILRSISKPKKLLQFIASSGVKCDNVTMISFDLQIS